MSDFSESQVIEDQVVSVRENYKVYKKRWLVLIAVFTLNLINGLQKSNLPIVKMFEEEMGMSLENYTILTQISLVLSILAILPFARALERYGLRKMSYISCIAFMIAHVLKAACYFERNPVITIVKENKFYVLIVGELFVGLANSIATSFSPKMAYDWFPIRESTKALILANMGYNVGAGASTFFVPMLVNTMDDMYKMGYIFLISAAVMFIIVICFIRRSRPKMPPSSSAILSAETNASLRDGLMVMLGNSSFFLLITSYALNMATVNALQLIFDDILYSKGYTNTFCGTLLSHAFIFGIVFSLMGAAWVDNSQNYIAVSRLASIICGVTFVMFCVSLNFPNIKSVILVTNVLASLGTSLMVPSLTQVCLRSAASILPEATANAIMNISSLTLTAIIINFEGPLERASSTSNIYQVLLATFSFIVMIVNILYAATFRFPKRERLQQLLGGQIALRCSHQILNNDHSESI